MSSLKPDSNHQNREDNNSVPSLPDIHASINSRRSRQRDYRIEEIDIGDGLMPKSFVNQPDSEPGNDLQFGGDFGVEDANQYSTGQALLASNEFGSQEQTNNS